MALYHCTSICLSGVDIKHKDNFAHYCAYMIMMYVCIFIVLFLSHYEIIVCVLSTMIVI